MSLPLKTYLNWSGGKDSALSLYRVLRDSRYTVEGLLTNVNAAHDRVSMHGVRRSLLQRQAASIGLPLQTIELPERPGMEAYEQAMLAKVMSLQEEGYRAAVFGDIFLEDLRQYRERQLSALGMDTVFPVWGESSASLMKEFLALGFKAVVVCVNEQYLDSSFCGRLLDDSFVNDLPAGVDICGENGEYHSFVFDGPVFRQPVGWWKGDTVRRTYPAPAGSDAASYGFYFCDLLL